MICDNNGCGCALKVASGAISGSGTPADPWIIDVAATTEIAQIEVDLANIVTTLDGLPGTYVDLVGDTMTGPLVINYPTGGQLLSLMSAGTAYSYLAWYQAGVRQGWCGAQVTTGHIWINADLNDLTLSATVGDVAIRAGGAERARMLGAGNLVIGKATTGVATAGFELNASNRVFNATSDNTSIGMNLNKIGAGAVSGATYQGFLLSGTVIGSITRNAATSAVLYNTSSDENLKNIIDDLDPELAEYVLGLIMPVMYSWKDDEGNTPIAGYIAQQVAKAWPQSVELGMVTPGYGDVSDRTFDSDGNETTPEGVWRPWLMSHTVLIPLLHASLVRTTTKLSYLRAEHDELRVEHEALKTKYDDLEDRISALEDA